MQEIFAVQVLQGIRFPELLEWNDERMAHSYVLPDEALAEVVLPTAEDLARSPAFHFQRGNDLYEQGKQEEAIAAYRQCLELEPDYPNARYNLGVALGDAERYGEASACMEEVLQAEPERAEAYNSLGYPREPPATAAQSDLLSWEQAIALQPDYAQAHFNLGLTLLQIGRLRTRLCRIRVALDADHLTLCRFAQPRWDGRSIPGQTLLILAQQGPGCHPICSLPASGGRALRHVDRGLSR